MLAHKHFGLPLPLNPQNPYRITVKRLLTEGVSVPDGVLGCIDAQVVYPWILEVEKWLLELEIPADVKRVAGPPPFYVVKGVGKWRNLITEDVLKTAPVLDLNIERICALVNLAGNKDGMIYQFIDLLKQELGYFETAKLAEKYAILRMDGI